MDRTYTSQSRGLNFLVDFLIVIFVSLLIANKLAPYMNADVMMNSIMSLQKVTLFYWGQDRLLNVLPLALSVVRNARLNVYLNSILSCLCFCSLAWAWARGIARSFEPVQDRFAFRRLVFLVTVLLFILVLHEWQFVDTSISHIEYTLSYTLFAWIVFDLILKPEFKPIDYVRVVILVVIGTGLNNSLVIPECSAFSVIAWMQRKVSAPLIVFAIVSLLSFKAWLLISSFYPHSGISYSDFDIQNVEEYSHATARNLVRGLDLPRLCAVVAFALALRLLRFNFPAYVKMGRIAHWGEICGALALFCLAWFLLFSVNSWIKASHFHTRYFVPIIFVAVGILAVKFAEYFLFLKPMLQNILCLLVAAFLGYFLAAKFTPLEKYPVFAQVAPSAAVDADGYAGDYWRVWPAVLRDLVHHKPAVGFADRADANRNAVIRQFSAARHPNGDLKVVCYVEATDVCVKQIQLLLPDYNLASAEPLDAESSVLRLMRMPP
ncbi:hypothetical protein [Methylovirgula sp. 4M-Z18]|uniref:hypothetical protein n=1 Tax=Methylovirgula sp. 4M-Z18 TaxID=2293567 RepID=UPI000E2EA15E|nr:hypothetical protein [Methylovirgula sp. 4M-Z18]RFB81371.1 hypothetical protein DYH55_08045 [Methylovirgula sp. 4M-Z18]